MSITLFGSCKLNRVNNHNNLNNLNNLNNIILIRQRGFTIY